MSSVQFLHETDDRKTSWFLQTLVTDRITAEDSDGACSVTEHRLPPGYETPYHLHNDSTEAFYIMDGELTIYIEGDSLKGTSGDTVVIPPEYEHGYRITSDEPARKLILFWPAGFEEYFHEAGQPAEQRIIPESPKSDIEDLKELAPEYDLKLLGPISEVEST